ncbi:4-hydroxy-tetrahydrodipicolinate synthase [Burkholderiaceae bacterium DAT-1]|nr:4-hydroxy-tetrahydrodipicolinate synthase [Burkholderiaceae bacterium DAT-1]
MKRIAHTSLWTALITPMHADGSLDLASLTALLHEQAAAGNGVILLGSTGEGANLSTEERKTILTHATGLNLPIPVMTGVGGLELHTQLEWLAFCETLPLAGYLMVTPIYAKPGAKGQAKWFRTLMDAVSKPCMLYNIPSRAGVAMPDETIESLLDHPNFAAVKESGGDPARFASLQQRFPQIAWYSGDDVLFGEHARLGASGLVSVASNVWPQETAYVVKRALSGLGGDVGPLLREVSESLFAAPNPIPAKAIMHEQGRISSRELRLPLCAEELASTELQRFADSLIKGAVLRLAEPSVVA